MEESLYSVIMCRLLAHMLLEGEIYQKFEELFLFFFGIEHMSFLILTLPYNGNYETYHTGLWYWQKTNIENWIVVGGCSNCEFKNTKK